MSMDKKVWWRSKTLWVNLVAGVALLVQSQFGFVIEGEVQGAILMLINFALRLITNEPVGLRDEAGPGSFPGVDAGGPGAGQ
jgi:hypothetical protein